MWHLFEGGVYFNVDTQSAVLIRGQLLLEETTRGNTVTKTFNWESSTKNLITFNFNIMGVH